MMRSFLVALLLCAVNVVWAEGVSVGYLPDRWFGRSRLCPDSGYADDTAYDESDGTMPSDSSVPIVWEERWGAVANESNGSGFGGVARMKTRAQTQAAALDQCKSTATVANSGC